MSIMSIIIIIILFIRLDDGLLSSIHCFNRIDSLSFPTSGTSLSYVTQTPRPQQTLRLHVSIPRTGGSTTIVWLRVSLNHGNRLRVVVVIVAKKTHCRHQSLLHRRRHQRRLCPF